MRQGTTVKYAQLAKWLCLADCQIQEILRLRSDVLSRLERLVFPPLHALDPSQAIITHCYII